MEPNNSDNWDVFFANVNKYLPAKVKLSKPWYGPNDMYAPILPDGDKMAYIYTILISGEQGSGKELTARMIAELWGDKLETTCIINCATIEPTLARSELFGHVKGAFSGATKDKDGLFGQYTTEKVFFLDELHRLSIDAQGALLRLIEYNEFKKVGDNAITLQDSERPKIIAAVQPKYLSNEDYLLSDLRNRFVFTVKIKPLRECPFSIPRLLSVYIYQTYSKIFSDKLCENKVKEEIKKLKFPEIDLWQFMAYRWPGNIRELKNEAFKTKINDKNIVETTLFGKMEYEEKRMLDYSFRHMFAKVRKTKSGFELKNKAKEPRVESHQKIKFIKPIVKDSVNYDKYNTKKFLTLLDLWNYKPFNKKLLFDANNALLFYENQKSKLKYERSLIDRAIEASKFEEYKKRATDNLTEQKSPKKPSTIDELTQVYKKLCNWNKVAKFYKVAPNTIYTWRKKLENR